MGGGLGGGRNEHKFLFWVKTTADQKNGVVSFT